MVTYEHIEHIYKKPENSQIKVYVADAPMNTKIRKFSFIPSQSTFGTPTNIKTLVEIISIVYLILMVVTY